MPPAVVCVVSWLVPGAGHLIQGRRQKGLVFLIALPVMFALGLSLNGRLFPFIFSDPLVGLAAIANLGMGVPYFIASALGLGKGVVTAAGIGGDGEQHVAFARHELRAGREIESALRADRVLRGVAVAHVVRVVEERGACSMHLECGLE